METKNQQSLPLTKSERFTALLNKKWFAVLITFVGFLLAMGILYLLGGDHEESIPVVTDYSQQITRWQSQYNDSENLIIIDKIALCEHIKQGAYLKMQANAADPNTYQLSPTQLIDLDKKRSMDCNPQDSFIPTAKALSFDTSSFNAQNNGNISNNNAIHTNILNSGTPVHNGDNGPHPIHKGSPGQQAVIDYAWSISHDKNFIYLLKSENGLLTADRMHSTAYYCPGKKGIFHDWGFGGISDCYHPEIVKDPRFFTDWKWQIDQVYKLYKSGTKFASKPHWAAMAKYFTWEI